MVTFSKKKSSTISFPGNNIHFFCCTILQLVENFKCDIKLSNVALIECYDRISNLMTINKCLQKSCYKW